MSTAAASAGPAAREPDLTRAQGLDDDPAPLPGSGSRWHARAWQPRSPPDVRHRQRGFACCGLRALYGRVSDDLFAVAGRAAQIIEWDRTHQYCGRCGTPTETAPAERAKRCPRCGLLSFPRLSPAIIVLVERGDEVLLARSPHFAEGMYSTLAGFVEPGESLEEAVYREVLEETGIAVTGLQYFGSQPWPFPHSLMIGFTARYAGGEITIDRNEIEDARWFTAFTLPRVPQKLSIARRLIDAFVARYREPLDQP
ncbi:MAG: hypothetical protein KatS3mg059_0912 [Thermomicrobiales bacterium]|nr:MAG: hypothetical protein KatS3mg059_0912 [Thermomicrobiales bacterium]